MTHEVPMTKSKCAALHLRYGTKEDITLELLLDTDDLPENARSVITEIVALRSAAAAVHREGEEVELEDRAARDDTTYRLDTTALTVIAIDQYGQEGDLNAEGEPCQTLGHLREFVEQLIGQGLEIPELLAEAESRLRDELRYGAEIEAHRVRLNDEARAS